MNSRNEDSGHDLGRGGGRDRNNGGGYSIGGFVCVLNAELK